MAEIIGTPAATGSRVDWAAVFAGAVLATATGLILMMFGAGLGLSVTSPYEGEGLSPALYVLGAGLWVLWVQLVSFSIGGYVAARLRARHGDAANEHEVDVRDGMHGLLAWGVGVIAAAAITFAGLGGATAAVETADSSRNLAASVAEAATDEIDAAAAREAADNPQAANESADERRAEIARKLSVIAAFITAASLLAGAAAALFSAGYGGKHRDQNTVLKFFVIRDSRTTATSAGP
jgi:hypothetical protein